MFLDTTVSVDLKKVRKLVEGDEFVEFLLSHTSDLGDAAYILQTIMEKIDADEASLDNE